MRKQINITKGLENPRFCGKFLSIFKVLRFENCFMVLDFNVQKKHKFQDRWRAYFISMSHLSEWRNVRTCKSPLKYEVKFDLYHKLYNSRPTTNKNSET